MMLSRFVDRYRTIKHHKLVITCITCTLDEFLAFYLLKKAQNPFIFSNSPNLSPKQ